MILYVDATTNCPDVVIDFIEVRLQSGAIVSLNWDESGIDRSETGFSAVYKGVYFGEEYANGKLDQLESMKVEAIALYSETKKPIDISLDEMTFEDQDRSLLFRDTYSVKGARSHD